MTHDPIAWLIPLTLSAAVAPTLLARRDWHAGLWAAFVALASFACLLASPELFHG